MGITDISSIWDSLFYPVLSTIVLLFAVYLIIGKKSFFSAKNDFSNRIEDALSKGDKILLSNDGSNKNYGNENIRNALSAGIIESIKKPATIVLIFFIVCFAVYKLMVFYSNMICPVTLSIRTDVMAAHNVHESIMASIWAHFPSDSFSTLCFRIEKMGSESSYVKNFDVNTITSIEMWIKTINIVSLILAIIALIKQKWIIALKGIIGFVITIALFLGVIYFKFTKFETRFQQAAYYTHTVVLLDGEVDEDQIDEAYEKVYLEYDRLKQTNGSNFRGFRISFKPPLD